MATMSTQPGSKVPIPKVPTAIEPDPPAIPEDLGNLFLSPTARYEPSSTGWYVRWNGCGAYIGTPDGRKQSALRGMAIIERLLGAQGAGVTTAQLHGYESTYVDGKCIASRVYQDFGMDGDTPLSEASGVHVANLVPQEAYNTRAPLRQFDLALELIRAKLPLLADHLSQRISTPTKCDRAWRYADDETQWTLGSIWQFDGSNLFVRDRDGSVRTWQIRFGHHECTVDGSDGILLLSAMLLHPGKELSADRVCNEAGVGPRWDTPTPGDTKSPHSQLSDFQELFKEFADDLDFVCGGRSYDDDGPKVDSWREHSVTKLIDDVKAVLAMLERSAIVSHAEHTLKGKGIMSPVCPPSRYDGPYTRGEDFQTLRAKLKRCKMFVADLQEFRRQNESQTPAYVTEQDMANGAFRTRGWVSRSVTVAVDEISNKNAFLGAYFRRAFRTNNGRFVLDVGSKWNVVG